jgi:ketosteroid isomerase-like protein
MSVENVELVREAFEAFNRGDLEEALERMHPDIEWRTLDAFPDAGTYRGREEVQEFWHTWRDHAGSRTRSTIRGVTAGDVAGHRSDSRGDARIRVGAASAFTWGASEAVRESASK